MVKTATPSVYVALVPAPAFDGDSASLGIEAELTLLESVDVGFVSNAMISV